MSNDAQQPKLKMPTPDVGYDEPIKGEWHWRYRLPGPAGSIIWEAEGTVHSSGDASRAVEAAKIEGARQWREWCRARGL